MKHTFCDQKIPLWVCTKMLEITVRVRLTYAIQTNWIQSARQLRREDTHEVHCTLDAAREWRTTKDVFCHPMPWPQQSLAKTSKSSQVRANVALNKWIWDRYDHASQAEQLLGIRRNYKDDDECVPWKGTLEIKSTKLDELLSTAVVLQKNICQISEARGVHDSAKTTRLPQLLTCNLAHMMAACIL